MSNKDIKNDSSIDAGSIRGFDIEGSVPNNLDILMYDSSELQWEPSSFATAALVTGPTSATSNALARFNGTTGKIIKNSGVTLDNSDNMTFPASTTLTIPNIKGIFASTEFSLGINTNTIGERTADSGIYFNHIIDAQDVGMKSMGINFFEQASVPIAVSAGNSTLYSSNDVNQQLLWVDDKSASHVVSGKSFGTLYVKTNAGITIIAQNQDQLLQHANFTAGTTNSTLFTQRDGTNGTISTFSDAGSGNVKVTTTASHSLAVNDIVSITGTTNYNNVYVVQAIGTTVSFDITATWVANDATGTYHQGSHLKYTGQTGTFFLSLNGNMDSITNADTYTFFIYQNATKSTEFSGQRKCDVVSSILPFNINSGYIVLNTNDIMTIAVRNTTSSGNLTIHYLSLALHQID